MLTRIIACVSSFNLGWVVTHLGYVRQYSSAAHCFAVKDLRSECWDVRALLADWLVNRRWLCYMWVGMCDHTPPNPTMVCVCRSKRQVLRYEGTRADGLVNRVMDSGYCIHTTTHSERPKMPVHSAFNLCSGSHFLGVPSCWNRLVSVHCEWCLLCACCVSILARDWHTCGGIHWWCQFIVSGSSCEHVSILARDWHACYGVHWVCGG